MNERSTKLLDIIAGLVVVWYSLPPDARTELHARFWHVASRQAGRAANAAHATGEQLGRLSIKASQRYRAAVQG